MQPTPNHALSRLRQLLRDEVRQLTDTRAEVRDDVELSQYGVDSLELAMISGRIEEEFGIDVLPSMMFRFRTIDNVCEELSHLLKGTS